MPTKRTPTPPANPQAARRDAAQLARIAAKPVAKPPAKKGGPK